ncbi:TonB-dependent receptor [Sphingomonas naphthae]|uniref:TonB-dependent receptor n=1 Tax=Sphingomonas naphthae TaxID=1813468 RepID=A0ABY7TIN9_9SPHN|nr:TonB-dependent receptor [Sphingomonas naphthae]WCT73097.1 TonB-dependent receptor [Sphingomonas naphthae]
MTSHHGIVRGLRAGTALLALCASGAALAQQAPATPPAPPATAPAEPETAEIVVTGFRQSLNSALGIKRSQSASIDVIKAEDAAEFPDLNLAESLQRIPGVTISRVNGEGRNVTVRGLGAEYTRVRINGMEAIATSGGTDASGGTNRGRGFDFNVFSSDLFNSLAVRKTATADVEEGSLGGTVDLQISRPFDYNKPTAVFSAQTSYNTLAEKATPRLSALVSTTTSDGSFGVLMSVSYEERVLKEEGANNTRWTFGGFNGGFSPASTIAGYTAAQINSSNLDNALFHPRIPGLSSYEIDQKRLGAAGSIQFRPSDSTLLTIDGLYSRLQGTREESSLGALSFSRSGTGKPQTIIREATIDANRNIIRGTFDNVDLRIQSRYDELKTDFYQVNANLEQKFGDRLKFVGMVGYADSSFGNPVQNTVTIDAVNTANFKYDYSSRFPLVVPGVDISQASTFSIINGTSEIRLRPQTVDNSFKNAKGFLEWKAIDALKLRAGVDYRDFKYDATGGQRVLGETVTPNLSAAQFASVVRQFTGFGKGINLPAGTPTGWTAIDVQAFMRLVDAGNNPFYAVGGVDVPAARGQFITARERNTGFWGMGEFDLGDSGIGIPLRGDFGLRYVKTTQDSTGYVSLGTTASLVPATRKYHRWLPSANLVFDITPNLLTRLAAAKTMARSNIAQLSPGGNLSVAGGSRTFSAGNPDLLPTESKNLDFAVEWYPTRGSVYAVALFYKDISSFAQSFSELVPYRSLGLPDSLLNGTTAVPTDVFTRSQPVNSPGGKLKGAELNIQQPLTFLPGILSNFGVLGNVTYVSANIEYITSTAGQTVTEPLLGLSKWAANGTVYYETKKFAIRGSVAYRSRYLTAVPSTEGQSYQGVNSSVNVDAQISYNINERLKLTIEGINLTDQFNDQFVDVTNRQSTITHTGRQFIAGLRWSL